MNQDGKTQSIIWPLLLKVNPILAMQQRPRWTAGRQIPELPVLPWNDEDRPPQINFGKVDLPPMASYMFPRNFGLCALGNVSVQKKLLLVSPYSNPNVIGIPAVVHELKPSPATFFTISGVTKDSTGAILGNCEVDLFESVGDRFMEETSSDSSGNYYFKSPLRTKNYYVVAYKTGSPDVAGTTVNTLVGA